MANLEVFIEYNEGEFYSDHIEVNIRASDFVSNDHARRLLAKACLRVVDFFKEDFLTIEELEKEQKK